MVRTGLYSSSRAKAIQVAPAAEDAQLKAQHEEVEALGVFGIGLQLGGQPRHGVDELLRDGVRSLRIDLSGVSYVSSAATQVLARWLSRQKSVARVYYTGLPDHPQYKLARKQQRGDGGIVSFDLKGGKKAAFKLINNTKMLSITANLGDTRTTITHPATTTHHRIGAEARARAGVVHAQRLALPRMPVGQHVTLAGAAVDRVLVRGRPMRVAVDHARDAMLPEGLPDRAVVHVHDVRRRHLLVRGAVGLHAAGNALTPGAGQRAINRLDGPAPREAAPALVAHVVRAIEVAVRDERRHAVQVEPQRVGQQAHARGGGEAVADQEIAVAVL